MSRNTPGARGCNTLAGVKRRDAFSMRLDFFGKAAGSDVMALYVAGSIVIFAALNLVVGTRFLNLAPSVNTKKLFKKKG